MDNEFPAETIRQAGCHAAWRGEILVRYGTLEGMLGAGFFPTRAEMLERIGWSPRTGICPFPLFFRPP